MVDEVIKRHLFHANDQTFCQNPINNAQLEIDEKDMHSTYGTSRWHSLLGRDQIGQIKLDYGALLSLYVLLGSISIVLQSESNVHDSAQ